MNKLIQFEDRHGFKKGIDTVANAVKVTLGPKGRNVIIGQNVGAPHITKDGVTVAKSINLKDPFENAGAQLMKEVAIRVCNEAGDGTTTATVLTQAIINEGLKILETNPTINPIILKRGIDNAVADIIKFIKENAIEINNDFNQIKNVATISANNDSEMGTLIADAVRLAGQNGVITVEESNNTETSVVKIEGVQIDRGYMSPYMITDPETNTCIFENPMIVLVDEKITKIDQILNELECASKNNYPVLLITNGIESNVMSTLVQNHVLGRLKICAIYGPGFGELRKEMMTDLAYLIGCEDQLDNFTNVYGFADRVEINKDSTTIIGGHGKNISTRIEKLISDKEEERAAKLSGGVVIIKVGATSEIEVKEKKDRIDDALCATRSAIEEGIVCGGGLTYLNAIKSVKEFSTQEDLLGWKVICNALKYPIFQILCNAGFNSEQMTDIISCCTERQGYNAKTDKYENFITSGIIDPAKVERVALESATSIAGLYLTAGCIIVNDV